ncbi:MAG: ABC transporter ATP-binding protein [Lachnospiraceae bacterium]|nr:ABC transporter ATP-binding protein [Lachnospiraceae bacterium]
MIELKGIDKIYNYKKDNEFQALYNVDLHIDKGEMVAIMGRSGAGKSTLLHVLGFVDTFEAGEYYLEGHQVKDFGEAKRAQIRNEKFGIIMQDFALVDNFSVMENVMLPVDFSKKKGREKKARVKEALKSVGIEDLAYKKVSKLSGGQKQRVAIARAIVNNPSVILADEPTGSLDTKTADEIMSVFKQLNQDDKTIIIITHDINIAKQCERIVEINDGRIAE